MNPIGTPRFLARAEQVGPDGFDKNESLGVENLKGSARDGWEVERIVNRFKTLVFLPYGHGKPRRGGDGKRDADRRIEFEHPPR